MDRKDIRAERNTDWHWEVSVSASIPTTPHHSQCFPPIRLLKKNGFRATGEWGHCDTEGILMVPALCLDCGVCLGRVKVHQRWHDFYWGRRFSSQFFFFLPLMIADRECFGHQWIFFFIIQLYLQFVCVHEGRRFHSAITAPNDHVELDNDQLWRWVGNNCGTPAFYRCASMFCNSPQKKEK